MPQTVFLTPLWILGFVLVLVSIVVNSISLGYGSVMLLSSLSVATIVISSFLTPCFFNEQLSCYKDVLCSFILSIGCILCITQSPPSEEYPREGVAAAMIAIMLSAKNVMFLLTICLSHIVFTKLKNKLLDELQQWWRSFIDLVSEFVSEEEEMLLNTRFSFIESRPSMPFMKMSRTAFQDFTQQVAMRGSFLEQNGSIVEVPEEIGGGGGGLAASSMQESQVRYSYPHIFFNQFQPRASVLDNASMRKSGSRLEEPLIPKEKRVKNWGAKKTVNMGKLTNVVTDENVLQLMERNFTCSTNTSGKVLPSNRELNDLVTSTNLKMLTKDQQTGGGTTQ